MKLNETLIAKGRIIEGETLPAGVLCRGVWPTCNIEQLNANNRIYGSDVWEHVRENEDILGKMKSRTFYGQAEHPSETASDLQLTSHIVTEMYIDKATALDEAADDYDVVYSKVDVLDTPCGRIINTLIEAGCQIGVSTRAEGDLEEAEADDGTKYQRVIAEAYDYRALDFTADPSTYGTQPQKVQSSLMVAATEGAVAKEDRLPRAYAQSILESLKFKGKKDKKTLAEAIKALKEARECPDNPGCACAGCGKCSKEVDESKTIKVGQVVEDIDHVKGTVKSIDEKTVTVELEDGTSLSIETAFLNTENVEVRFADQAPLEDLMLEPEPGVVEEPELKSEPVPGEEKKLPFEGKEDGLSTYDVGFVGKDDANDHVKIKAKTEDEAAKRAKSDHGAKSIFKIKKVGDVKEDDEYGDRHPPADHDPDLAAPGDQPGSGETYTGYYVTVSGNQRFPGGGTIIKVAASGPEDAYRQAFLKSQDMTPEEFEEEYGPDASASELVEYQRGVWAKEQLDDSSLLLVATGERSKYELIGLADGIWAGDEMDDPDQLGTLIPDDLKKERGPDQLGTHIPDEWKKGNESKSDVKEYRVGQVVQIKDAEGNTTVVPQATVAAVDEMLGDDGDMHEAVEVSGSDNEDKQQWYREDEYQISVLESKTAQKRRRKLQESYEEMVNWMEAYFNRTPKRKRQVLVAQLVDKVASTCDKPLTESKVGATAKTIRKLQIKEASTRAERDEACVLLDGVDEKIKEVSENRDLETRIMVRKLKEAKSQDSQVPALCQMLERRTRDMTTIQESLIKVREAHEAELVAVRAECETKARKVIIEGYVRLKLSHSGLVLPKSSRALLEGCDTVEEVDKVFGQVKEAIRRGALRPQKIDSITVKHVNEASEKDKLRENIKDKVRTIAQSM